MPYVGICRNCNADISHEARVCPHCGQPNPGYRSDEEANAIRNQYNKMQSDKLFTWLAIAAIFLFCWCGSCIEDFRKPKETKQRSDDAPVRKSFPDNQVAPTTVSSSTSAFNRHQAAGAV